ncbi:hypothetical protein FOZ61_001163 [Perkinsus olseni]|nr:hypothetical protein FOZ61_001163 [Perkinsus olseni]
MERVKEVGGSFKNTVFSFIPNTSELAFYGMVKQYREDLYREQRRAMETGINTEVLDQEVREEKVVHKDAKLRTFIQEDASREAKTFHAYDVHYGTVREGEVLVALDDSIVRGNTLKNAIIKTLERLKPSSIVIVSSAPLICYPDPYGIDMAKLADFVAFKAAIALLRSRGKDDLIHEVYEQCLQDADSDVNYVKRIYEGFTQRELEDKVAEIIQPENCTAKVQVVYQTVDSLHKAIPEHLGDWYFTGDYPTLGGTVVCKRAFTLWMEGRGNERCYGLSSEGGSNVLVVGSGGREHALATAIAASHKVKRVYVAPGNAGEHEKIINIPAVNASKETIVGYCRKKHISLVVVGPEQPLAEGLADVVQEAGIPVFGPTAAAAEVEASKSWAKDFMRRHGIPTAEFVTAVTPEEGEKAVDKICSSNGVVVKASGLAAGKGVIVADSAQQGKAAVREIFSLYGGPVVVEELLQGAEVSVFALTNGRSFVVLPPARDHKRVFNDDEGPNTGGMGAFVTNSLLTKSELENIKERIVAPSIEGLAKEGRPFSGCLYIGLMMTPHGPKVLEYNCRFGDPETQALLPLLLSNKIDCYDLFLSCTAGKQLGSKLSARLEGIKGSSVTVVLASGGYPGKFNKGYLINGVNRAECVPGVQVYYAGAQYDDNGVIVTSGGRVLSITAGGETVKDAAERAYCAVRSITFEGVHYRTDIAMCSGLSRVSKSRSFSESGSDTPKSAKSGITYLAAGVDIEAGEAAVDGFKPLVKRTQRPGMGGSLGDFGGFCDLAKCGEYDEPVLVSGTDGVGTKLKVANTIGKHDTVGIDLVAMCANDVVVHGAEPLFFLDYFAVGKLDVKQAVEVVKGIADGCIQAGCTLLGGETAELPGIFANTTEYDIAGFVVGVKEKSLELPDKDSMQHGDILIGLLSSGVHSNGFSLVRKIAEVSGLKMSDPAPYDPTTTLGVSLLTPTKIYVKTILELVRLGAGKLKGAAHITGGGLFQNIPRMLPEHLQAVIRADTWELPAVFRWCATQGKLEATELASTFNVGIGMVLCVAAEHKDTVMKVLRGLDEEAVVIGELVSKPITTDPKVVIIGAETEWTLLSDMGVNTLLQPSVLSGLFDEDSPAAAVRS